MYWGREVSRRTLLPALKPIAGVSSSASVMRPVRAAGTPRRNLDSPTARIRSRTSAGCKNQSRADCHASPPSCQAVARRVVRGESGVLRKAAVLERRRTGGAGVGYWLRKMLPSCYGWFQSPVRTHGGADEKVCVGDPRTARHPLPGECRLYPADHWMNDSEQGGGRILGEVCHFVDFLCFLAGSCPIEVQAGR